MSNIGLILIIIGWIIQFNSKASKIEINFLKFYLAGVAFLVVDAYLSNSKLLSLLNLISMGVAGLMLLKLTGKK